VPINLFKTSILHIWLKTREENQTNKANIKIKNEQINSIIAETNKFKSFVFFELSPQIEGNAFLEWFNGGKINLKKLKFLIGKKNRKISSR